jgi:hypothetical protein
MFGHPAQIIGDAAKYFCRSPLLIGCVPNLFRALAQNVRGLPAN